MLTLNRCASGSFAAMLQNGSVMIPGVISPTPSSSNSTRPLLRSRTKRSCRSRFSREGRGHIAINENRLARSIGRHGLAVVERGVRDVFAGVCDLSEHALYDAVAQSHAKLEDGNPAVAMDLHKARKLFELGRGNGIWMSETRLVD